MTMKSIARPGAIAAVALTIGFALLASPATARAQGRQPSAGAMAHAAETADEQMSGDPFAVREHIALSPLRPWNPADSARAAQIAAVLRQSLEKYRDVEAARRDGYQIFAPDVPGQRLYHFNNYAYAMASEATFDPTRPTSLLYRKSGDRWVLEGAMYTAHGDLPLDQLDERVPLSVARWHRHVNFCIPPWGGRERWGEMKDGKPIFGPTGVATKEECDAAGGRFLPQVFGWMLHAMPFASDDPRVVFGGDHRHAPGHER